MRVEIAGSGCGIEHRTRFVVGEVFELALRALTFAEQSGREFTGKVGRDSGDGIARTLANACRAIGIGVREFGETFPKASGIELVDGEDADATGVQPGRQTRKSPLRRAASASATSRICTSWRSRSGRGSNPVFTGGCKGTVVTLLCLAVSSLASFLFAIATALSTSWQGYCNAFGNERAAQRCGG